MYRGGGNRGGYPRNATRTHGNYGQTIRVEGAPEVKPVEGKKTIRGVVIGHFRRIAIVQTLEKGFQNKFMVLDSNSAGAKGTTAGWIPPLHHFLTIVDFKPAVYDKNLSDIKFHVESWSSSKGMQYSPEDPVYTDKNGVTKPLPIDPTREVVCVAEVTNTAIMVVGPSYRKPSPSLRYVQGVKEGDMLLALKLRSRPFFRLQETFGTVCLIKDFKAEAEFEQKQRDLKATKKDRDRAFEEGRGRGDVLLYPPKGDGFIQKLEILSDEKKKDILELCRNKEGLDLEYAVLYIRDPRVAVLRMEEALKTKQAVEYTAEVTGRFYIDADDRLTFSVMLTNTQSLKLTLSQSLCVWQLGTFLKVQHAILHRKFKDSYGMHEERDDVGMLITDINYLDEGCEVLLHAAKNYEKDFEVLRSISGLGEKRTYKVGPSDFGFGINQHIRAFMANFYDFFYSPLFSQVIGKSPASFSIGGSVSSGSSEEDSVLQEMMNTEGFFSLEAPPGTGKTGLITKLINEKMKREDHHFVVTAMTNNAVDNVVERTCKDFPEMEKKIVREHSSQSAEGISEEALRHSLQYHMDHMMELLPVESHKNVMDLLDCKKQLQDCIQKEPSFEKRLALLEELKDVDRQLRKEALAIGDFFVVGSSAAIMVRHAHQYRIRRIPDELRNSGSPGFDGHWNDSKYYGYITDMVVDEASQLSTTWALALYMIVPSLKNVVVVGDSKQLEPFSVLVDYKDTFLYQVATQCEHTRVRGLAEVKKAELRNVYRCHPKIVDILLKPIYGDKVISASDEHNLASELNLEVADADSSAPVVFIDYGYVDSTNNVNKVEIDLVVNCLGALLKTVPGSDIAVICQHKAQLAKLARVLKGKGKLGRFRTEVELHTVDSFQGKEARVVIVMMTKTCIEPSDASTALQFICDSHREVVAVSRAQDAAYLFGQWTMLARTAFWSQFVPGIIREKCLVKERFGNPATLADYEELDIASKLGSH